MTRKIPNVLLTGTPGVGKSRIAKHVCKLTGLEHINISQFAMSKNLILEHDDARDCDVIDEDKVVAKIRKKVDPGGLLIDYHSCDFFPKDWFDKIFVVRANNSVLHDRLKERKYKPSKIKENIECEIFNVILSEACETFGENLVVELNNNDKKELRKNIKFIINEVTSLRTIVGKSEN